MNTRVLLVLAATFAFPAAAQASDVSSDGTTTTLRSGLEPADVRIFTAFGPPWAQNIQVTDLRGDLGTGAGCTAGSPILCVGTRLNVVLNGGSDRSVSAGNASEVVSGGSGNDVISSSGQDTSVSGGAGNDVIRANANQSSQAHGDGGDDVLWGYENFPALYGDIGDDFLFADGQSNRLVGGSGNDEIVGAARRLRGGTVDGGSGADVIAFLASDDPGNDAWSIDAGDGPDTVVGSKAADTISGGAGADQIDVTGDGRADSVMCGGGRDRVYADAEDVVAADCELKLSGPMPPSAAVQEALDRATHIRDELTPLFDGPR